MSVTWLVQPLCGGVAMGEGIPCDLWSVWSVLAAYKRCMPASWSVELYAVVRHDQA